MSNREFPHIAENIENLRSDKGVSLTVLAEQAGIPYSTFRRLVQRTPEQFKLAQLSSIAGVLGVSLTELVSA